MKHFLSGLLAVLGLGACLLVVSPAPAGSCYSAPSYSPAYSYTPSYYPSYQTTYVTSFLQLPVPVYPVFGVVAESNKETAKTSPCATTTAEVQQLRNELQELRQQLRQRPQLPAQESLPAPKPAVGQPAGQEYKEGSSLSPSETGHLWAAVQASCARCHNGNKAAGGLSLVRTDGQGLAVLSLTERLKAFRRVALAKEDPHFMPQGGQPVDNDVLALFTKWAAD